MGARGFQLTHPFISPHQITNFTTSFKMMNLSPLLKQHFPSSGILRWSKSKDEQDLQELPPGLAPEFYDDDWQAQQREKTKELHRRRQEEDEEEERKVQEYREIGLRLKEFPEEDVKKARRLVSSFIRAEEEVEEKIEEAAERGELDELVLMVIWNRLDLARRDDEKDAIRSLDLLYRRVETEILKREASPAMRLLNDLLNMHDGFDDDGWLKECKKRMIETFPKEDPFSIIVPAGFDIDEHEGPIRPPLETDEVLLRVDFVREVDALLREVRAEQQEAQDAEGLDAESVAARLKQQEKQRTIRQVVMLLELAVNLQWVCLIDENEDILFHAYVQPQIPITDYRSDVTGLSEEHLRDALPLEEVQEKIQEILYNGESIGIARLNGGKARLLVGHSLEHDLDCLRITYPDHLIRDTAKYHPLMKTNLVSHSLKYLTKMYLGYDIQMGVHDPYEDCVSVMRLYKRMRDQDHLKDFVGACLPSSVTEFLTNEFDHCKMKDLEKLTPDELYEMSRSKYHCWCLDSVNLQPS